MRRFSHEVTAFGGLVLLLTGCGGLLSGGDDDCAAADCGSLGGSTGLAGRGGSAGIGPGRGGSSGTGGSGRGGTGTESGGSSGLTGGSGGSVGSTGGSGALGGTSATRGGSSGSAGVSGKSGTSGSAGTSGTAGEAGASSVADQCTQPSDCTLVAVDCCGSCQPKASDFVALNHDAVGDYLENRPCTDRICPECAPTGAEWLTAICVAGHCQVLDARESELSACDVSDDCQLRKTLECCECGAEGGWVSLNVSSSATLTGLVCDEDQGCDTCVPIAPETLVPACVEGRCQTMLPTR